MEEEEEEAAGTKPVLMVVLAILPAFRRLRQGDCKFEANLGYLARFSLKNKVKLIKVILCSVSRKYSLSHESSCPPACGIMRKISSTPHVGTP